MYLYKSTGYCVSMFTGVSIIGVYINEKILFIIRTKMYYMIVSDYSHGFVIFIASDDVAVSVILGGVILTRGTAIGHVCSARDTVLVDDNISLLYRIPSRRCIISINTNYILSKDKSEVRGSR